MRQANVRKRIFLEVDELFLVGIVERQDARGVAPRSGGEQRLARLIDGEAADDEFLLRLDDGDRAMIRQQAVAEVVRMDHLEFAAAEVKRLAVGGKAEAVERLLDRHTADDAPAFAFAVDDDDFMFAVAGVLHGEPFAAGMESDVDGEIADFEMFAGGSQRPQVRQLNEVAVDTGQQTRPSGGLRGQRFLSTVQSDGQTATDADEEYDGANRAFQHRSILLLTFIRCRGGIELSAVNAAWNREIMCEIYARQPIATRIKVSLPWKDHEYTPLRTFSRLLGLVALAMTLAVLFGCGQEPTVGPPTTPPPTKASVGSNDNITLEEHGDQRRVLVNATVTRRSRNDPGYGPDFNTLEFFLVRRGLGREYESILDADVDARKVYEALVRAKAVSGEPVRFEPYQAPRGQMMRILLRYEQDGKQHTVPAQSWLRTKSGGEAKLDWVFAGSRWLADDDNPNKLHTFLAQSEGVLMSLGNMESALLDVNVRSSNLQADIDLDYNSERIPPIGTPVTIILEPVGEYKRGQK